MSVGRCRAEAVGTEQPGVGEGFLEEELPELSLVQELARGSGTGWAEGTRRERKGRVWREQDAWRCGAGLGHDKGARGCLGTRAAEVSGVSFPTPCSQPHTFPLRYPREKGSSVRNPSDSVYRFVFWVCMYLYYYYLNNSLSLKVFLLGF